MSYYVIDVIMTLRDVVGWLVRGFRKRGCASWTFLLGPPEHRYFFVQRVGVFRVFVKVHSNITGYHPSNLSAIYNSRNLEGG